MSHHSPTMAAERKGTAGRRTFADSEEQSSSATPRTSEDDTSAMEHYGDRVHRFSTPRRKDISAPGNSCGVQENFAYPSGTHDHTATATCSAELLTHDTSTGHDTISQPAQQSLTAVQREVDAKKREKDGVTLQLLMDELRQQRVELARWKEEHQRDIAELRAKVDGGATEGRVENVHRYEGSGDDRDCVVDMDEDENDDDHHQHNDTTETEETLLIDGGIVFDPRLNGVDSDQGRAGSWERDAQVKDDEKEPTSPRQNESTALAGSNRTREGQGRRERMDDEALRHYINLLNERDRSILLLKVCHCADTNLSILS